MIKYKNNIIFDWNFDTSNIIKVYRNNAIVFYKVSGGSPTPEYKVCFAVVDDISQYTDREFEDVYDNATKKWYKLNNLNQYEEYGAYGNGRSVTTYKGKLTIDEGYEYEWNGSEWVNIGELSGTSTTIKSPEYIERTASYSGYCSLLEYLTEDTRIIIKHRQTSGGGGRIIGDYNLNDNDDWRLFFFFSELYYDFITQRKSTSKSMPMSAAEEWEVGNYYIKNTESSSYYINGTPQTFSSRPDHLYIYHSGGVGAGESGDDYGEIYYIKIYRGDVLVRDFIPWTDMNGNYGLYDKVERVVVNTVGSMTASTTINDVEVVDFDYPKYYSEKSDPLNNLAFNTLAEAQTYAYNNCVYDGMRATIDGNIYYFDSSDDNGWVKVTEYFTVDLNSQWQDSTSYGSLSSDTANYDFYESFGNYNVGGGKATMFITIDGYASFTFKVRNSSESNFDYVVVNNLDDTTVPSWQPSVGSGTASSGKVYYTNKNKSSNTTWYDVTFNGLDGGEHIITVTYGKDSIVNGGDDRGYVAIPKKQ